MGRDPDSEFREYFARVERAVSSRFQNKEFVDSLVAALANLDAHKFNALVESVVTDVRGDVAKFEAHHSTKAIGGFLAGSFQYDSVIFGRWFRFRFSEWETQHYEPTSDPLRHSGAALYDPLDQQYMEDLIERAPREDNLLFNENLRKSLWLQFGGQRTPPELPGVEPLHITSETWRAGQRAIFLLYRLHKIYFRDLLLGRPDLPYKVFNEEPLVAQLIQAFQSKLRDDNALTGTVAGDWVQEPLTNTSGKYSGEWTKCLKVFLFTYFYTIMYRVLPDNKAIHQIIIPVLVGDKWVGSFCGAYSISPERRIPHLQIAYEGYCRRLHSIEALALEHLPKPKFSITESILRLCTVVPLQNETLPRNLDLWRTKLVSKFQGTCDHVGVDGKIADPDLEQIAASIVSASTAFLGIVDRIQSRFADEAGNSPVRPQVVFLHSDPGLGKESLARLFHYFSRRSYDRDYIAKTVESSMAEVTRLPHSRDQLSTETRDRLDADSWKLTPEWEISRSFNYKQKNAGTLRPDSFATELFGNAERPGLMTIASMLGGTVFLDEINTAHREVVNGLLRALEYPFAVEPEGTLRSIRLNLLVIFASNIALDTLVRERDFNPAFADRVNLEMRIPPLAERREDIPLIINRLLRSYNFRTTGSNRLVRFVDLDGLRLLMELPWRRNVRALRTFVDDLMGTRMSKTLSKETFQRITTEEIVQTLSRGEYF